MFEDISREEVRDPAPVKAISVFSREDGGIVIQQGRPMAKEDPYIVVPPEDAENLIDAIRREMKAE